MRDEGAANERWRMLNEVLRDAGQHVHHERQAGGDVTNGSVDARNGYAVD